jgi:predicted RNA-binding Zn ribbon-like protein
LTAVKSNALKRIDDFHSEVISRLVGSPTQVEKDTWALKLEVANAITGKTAVSATGQAFLASAGIDTAAAKSAWAASVLAKSAAYAQVVGLAERLRDTARTAVKSATDEATLTAALDAQRAAADAAVASLMKAS